MSRQSDQSDYITELFLLEQKRKARNNLRNWDQFKLAIYDPKKGEFLGKDGLRWGK